MKKKNPLDVIDYNDYPYFVEIIVFTQKQKAPYGAFLFLPVGLDRTFDGL